MTIHASCVAQAATQATPEFRAASVNQDKRWLRHVVSASLAAPCERALSPALSLSTIILSRSRRSSHPPHAEVVEPPLQLDERLRRQCVAFFAPLPVHRDKASIFQDVQMLEDILARDWIVLGELGGRSGPESARVGSSCRRVGSASAAKTDPSVTMTGCLLPRKPLTGPGPARSPSSWNRCAPGGCRPA